ncbi:MAG: hypothetical protein Q4F85_15170 [Prevotella sp.]|nr:hypothetical protein [Prevotella sp.]
MKKAFIPICLYTNGFFLVKENLRFFLHIFSDYSELLFVIVDKLYGNNLLIKDKATDPEDAKRNYEKRGLHIFSHVRNTIQDYIKSHNSYTKYHIVRWNDIANRQEYTEIKQRAIEIFNTNLNLRYYSNMFIIHNLKRMTDKITQRKIELEHEYLFEEIAMSIYLTEFLEYDHEIWEKPQSEYLPDPIDILYNEERESLYLLLEKEYSIRSQYYLAPIINKYLDRFNIRHKHLEE